MEYCVYFSERVHMLFFCKTIYLISAPSFPQYKCFCFAELYHEGLQNVNTKR